MLRLDHIAVTGATLEAATAHVEEALGVAMKPGGQHAVFHTHNALLGLEGGLYLEAIAINPNAPKPERPRWFDMDRFEGAPRVTNWICQCDDLEKVAQTLPGVGDVLDLARDDLTWRVAVPGNGQLPFDQCHPAVIQWKTGLHPSARLGPSGCRMTRLIVCHPDAGALSDLIMPHLTRSIVLFETGARALRAEFDTPHGPRVLE